MEKTIYFFAMNQYKNLQADEQYNRIRAIILIFLTKE